jgi:hypothetical protein
MTSPLEKKPTKAFLVSLAGGLMIFGVAVSRITVMALYHSPVMPGLINAGYAMLQSAGEAGGDLSYVMAGAAAASGFFVITGAVMIHLRPAKTSTWVNFILAFSFVSFIGSGGLFIGAVLGIVGGALALVQEPNPEHVVPPKMVTI